MGPAVTEAFGEGGLGDLVVDTVVGVPREQLQASSTQSLVFHGFKFKTRTRRSHQQAGRQNKDVTEKPGPLDGFTRSHNKHASNREHSRASGIRRQRAQGRIETCRGCCQSYPARRSKQNAQCHPHHCSLSNNQASKRLG